MKIIFFICFVIIMASGCHSSQNAYEPNRLDNYPKNCVQDMHTKLCCDGNKKVAVAIIKSQTQYERHTYYNLIESVIGKVDFNYYDLVVPVDLPINLFLKGTPTSNGREWMIYNSIGVSCHQDSVHVSLECNPFVGSSGAFYSKKIPKQKLDSVSCGCTTINSSYLIQKSEKHSLIQSETLNNIYIYEGKGFDTIYIYKTTPKQIIEFYGKGKITKGKRPLKDYSSLPIFELEYEKLGLKFYGGSKNKPIYAIEVFTPASARTSKGIKIGESTRDDIIRLYGKPEKREQIFKWNLENKDNSLNGSCDSIYCYSTLGIDFSFQFDSVFIANKLEIMPPIKKHRLKLFQVKKIKIYYPETKKI